ncbi:hypothetical protein ColKHC_14300 [Colletotrichum higginsianum]|nr:hypothetical protein ColKHC_14300 [Colletotrichum higginsianum]
MARKATEAEAIWALPLRLRLQQRWPSVRQAVQAREQTAMAVSDAKQALETAEAAYKACRDQDILQGALDAISKQI